MFGTAELGKYNINFRIYNYGSCKISKYLHGRFSQTVTETLKENSNYINIKTKL